MTNKLNRYENYVILLGTKGGPAIRYGSTNPTSNLLIMEKKIIIIDCGLGVTRSLVDNGVALKDIDYVFVTHMHSDHYIELGPLLHTSWCSGLNKKIIIYGPPELRRYWKNYIEAMKDDIELRVTDEGRPNLKNLVTIKSIKTEKVEISTNLIINAIKNKHPPLTNSFALSFKGMNSHIVFSGDTTFLPALAKFAKGADLLIHEAMLKNGLNSLVNRIGNTDDRLMSHLLRSHTMAEDVGKIASMAKVKSLAINHLIPSDDPSFSDSDWLTAIRLFWSGPLHVGKDNLRINLQ